VDGGRGAPFRRHARAALLAAGLSPPRPPRAAALFYVKTFRLSIAPQYKEGTFENARGRIKKRITELRQIRFAELMQHGKVEEAKARVA